MPSKRYADWDNDDVAFASPSKRTRVNSSNTSAKSRVRPVTPSIPRTRYKPHADSGVGKDFHSIPYPLTLLPKKTWESLNRGEPNGAVCASCGKPRPSTDHVMGSSGRPALQDISPNSDLRLSGLSSGDNSKSAVCGAALSKQPDSSEADANVLKSKVQCSYQTLLEFYTLLDKIERTSPMGARYLEAYAERLHTETCKDCWFERNIVKELLQEAPKPEPEPKSQPEPKLVRQSHASPYPARRTKFPVQRPSPPTAAPSYTTVGPPIRQTAPISQIRPSQVGGAPQASNVPPHPLASTFQTLAAGNGAVVLPDLPESPAVMILLALWARTDHNLAQLFEAFAKRTATAEQERIFNFYVTAARYRVVPAPQPQPQPQSRVPSVQGPTFGQPFIGSKSRPR